MRVIDSHTEGEPTRVVVNGGPDLGAGTLAERRALFARDCDEVRRFVIHEPRGHAALVGALLCTPTDPSCAAGAIFFNNAGYLGMCGHATIGLAVTLAHMGRIVPGRHRIETPVGVVAVELHDAPTATIENVESYRHRKGVAVEVEGLGAVTGDIAWGGNWFFLADHAPCDLTLGNLKPLSDAAIAIQHALAAQGITGKDGAAIDHVEFFGPGSAGADSRNFVMCPGGAFDRSPCGTGTSAKLACLSADGKLQPDEPYVPESIIGSRFTARYRKGSNGGIIPSITGRAYICSEAVLRADPGDPFRFGIGL